MLKKIFGLLVCMIWVSIFSIAEAHGTFTWFGLKRDNTEIIFRSKIPHSNVHHKVHYCDDDCDDDDWDDDDDDDCCYKYRKKGPKPYRGWKKYDD